jgi:hypothetical protein
MVDQIDKILNLTAKTNDVLGAMDQEVPVPGTRTSALRQMVAKKPTETVTHLGCTHRNAPILKHTVELTSRATTPLHQYEHRI